GDGLCLEGLAGPARGHLVGDDAADVVLEVERVDGLHGRAAAEAELEPAPVEAAAREPQGPWTADAQRRLERAHLLAFLVVQRQRPVGAGSYRVGPVLVQPLVRGVRGAAEAGGAVGQQHTDDLARVGPGELRV